jgi:tRNA threonylcarbamoyl adenosine modification protein YeaZ
LFIKAPLKQSELLFPELSKLLRKSRVSKSEIGLLIVDVGPGSFTGVRVGVASARALGQALRVPVVGVSSLAAIARRHRGNGIVPWLPALKDEVYFQIGPLPRWGTRVEFEAALRKIKKPVLATGHPHVRDLAEAGLEIFLKRPNKKLYAFSNVHPLYLQPSWAERKKQ